MEKDRWDKFDVIIKGIATIIIPVVIGYYTWSQHSIAEENRRSQDAIAEENRRSRMPLPKRIEGVSLPLSL